MLSTLLIALSFASDGFNAVHGRQASQSRFLAFRLNVKKGEGMWAIRGR
jgi:hypothetical protein